MIYILRFDARGVNQHKIHRIRCNISNLNYARRFGRANLSELEISEHARLEIIALNRIIGMNDVIRITRMFPANRNGIAVYL